MHSFFIEAGEKVADHTPEAGIEVRLVTPAELAGIIKAGQFDSQQHLGTLLLARLHGLPRFADCIKIADNRASVREPRTLPGYGVQCDGNGRFDCRGSSPGHNAARKQTIARSFARIRAHNDPAIFISLRDEAEALAEARALAKRDAASLPLYGVPVAIKDNIDAAGFPTTAACPAFSYSPKADATAVARLRAAGAIVIGKTNLDQFATGLVGVRSPYGVPRNPFNPALIPGGSSSGSAVAVSAGLVPLALGTDTAGSGRVPAGLNNIVGLKPSLGLVSTTGVVPACRSLDCVSVFALTADDAFRALSVMAGPDETDPYSRAIRLGALSEMPPVLKIGIPRGDGLKFFGDKRSEAAFQSAVKLLQGMGVGIVELDISAFLQTARLLYEGPWAAERWAAVGDFIAQHPDDIHPVTKKIISSGRDPRRQMPSRRSISSPPIARSRCKPSLESMR